MVQELKVRRLSDRYFPQRGNDGYRVAHYDLTLDYRVGPNRLAGTAVLSAAATGDGPLRTFALDFGKFRIGKVLVDGTAAHFSHRGEKLRITPDGPIPAGAEFTVEVRYTGNPKPSSSPFGELGWEQLTDGSLVASQPIGAPSWFPCDDRPAAKARYRISITTGALYRAVANGRLTSHTRGGSTATWVYEEDEPMASYLATVQIGRYECGELPGAVPQRLVHPGRIGGQVHRGFARQPEMMEVFTRLFGPYPFHSYTVVIADDLLEIPVEAQGMSTFGINHASGRGGGERLIAHELAHQWFGNSLTLGDWRDIWLHEGFAAYAEWLWSEAGGGETADQHARRWHRRLAALPRDLLVGDPGERHLFDDRVYKRGALTLHALRLRLGDAAFFELLRAWTAAFRHSTVSTADFVAFVPGAPEAFFHSWLYHLALPPLSP